MAKALIEKSPTLAYYDPRRTTIVSADASSFGIGACLMQEINGSRKPIAFASRTLTDSEKRYAQIEKECLAGVWACERFSQYLFGLPTFVLATDHKPLVPLMMSKDIDQVPARCQRLLLRMLRFNPKVIHVPGKSLVVADTLSRRPLQHKPQDVLAAAEVTAFVEAIERNTFSPSRLNQLQIETDRDEELQVVIDYVVSGWPEYARDVPQYLKKFFEIRNNLSVADRLLLYNDRIYVPKAAQREILDRIHHGHFGISKCMERARGSVYWLGITGHIENLVKSCEHCQKHQKTQRHEPLMPTPLPERPWQRVAADLCDHDGTMYLVVVDYYSRFIEISKLNKVCTSDVVKELKCIFARYGIPDVFVSDNGPQYSSAEFAKFAAEYEFSHVTSSPHNPQSNGEVECAVQTAKAILDQKDPELALLVYRATPVTSTGFSPSQLLMGRQLATTLPTLARQLKPEWPEHSKVLANDDAAKDRQKYYYDRRHGVRSLPALSPGEQVLTKLNHEKTWSGPATVTGNASTPRSVVIQTPNRSVRRNRRNLQRIVPNTEREIVSTPARNQVTTNVQSDSQAVHVTAPNGRPPDSGQSNITTRCGRISRPVNRLDL
jgi:transposase InsO family protein